MELSNTYKQASALLPLLLPLLLFSCYYRGKGDPCRNPLCTNLTSM